MPKAKNLPVPAFRPLFTSAVRGRASKVIGTRNDLLRLRRGIEQGTGQESITPRLGGSGKKERGLAGKAAYKFVLNYENYILVAMEDKLDSASKDFKQAADHRQPVTLALDDDVLDWIKAEYPQGWQEQINGLLRFFMDTSQHREAEFARDTWEPGEMDSRPAPELTL